MDSELTWAQIALRLAVTVVVALAIGFDRSQRGRTAGMRTTLLVCLAACLASIEANRLLQSHWTGVESYLRLDPMRLPLGVLSGIGFIGAGAILRRGELVRGLTTAATLWIVTVIGLIIGAGQIPLGVVAGVIALACNWALKLAEIRMPSEQHGLLSLVLARDGPEDEQVRGVLRDFGRRIGGWAVTLSPGGERRLDIALSWQARPDSELTPAFVAELAGFEGVGRVEWRPDEVAAMAARA